MRSSTFFRGSAVILLVAAASAAQAPPRTNNVERSGEPLELIAAEKAIDLILSSSGKAFTDGLTAYADRHRPEALTKFNSSVEVFLHSALDVQQEPRLQACFNKLVESIYRMEFPSVASPPEIKELSQTCGWKIPNGLVSKAVLVTKILEAKTVSGFSTQDWKPSPQDELSRLELSPESQPAKPTTSLTPGVVLVPVPGKRAPGTTYSRPAYDDSSPGPKPTQAKDGKVAVVIDYFNATLDDPFSMKFDTWSRVIELSVGGLVYWAVTVKYRAKNTFAAYVLSETTFYIRNNRVVSTSPRKVVLTSSSPPLPSEDEAYQENADPFTLPFLGAKRLTGQRLILAEKRWATFWRAFARAIRTKDVKALVELSSSDEEFYDGGGGGTSKDWFNMMVPEWRSVAEAAKAEVGPIYVVNLSGSDRIQRMTKKSVPMIFSFDGKRTWRFMGVVGH